MIWKMSRRRGASFELKVVGVCLAATLIALTAAFGLFLWQDVSADRADLATDYREHAVAMAPLAAHAFETGNVQEQVHVRDVIAAPEHVRGAVYVAADGRRLDLTPAGGIPVDGEPLGRAQPSSEFTRDGVRIHVPVLRHGARVGELILDAHDEEVERSFRHNAMAAAGLTLAATLLAALIAKLLAHRSLKPLNRLNEAIERIRWSKDFEKKVEVVTRDEFGRLTENFNALLEELQAYDKSLHEAINNMMTARDAADEANVMKTQFLANMSHEIRTPLNGVLGMAQVMATGPLTPEQRDRLDVIRKSGESLLCIVNDVLDLSKIEAGKFDLEAAPFDLDEVARGACSVFTALANAKGVSFGLDIAERARGTWIGDSARLKQVLYNLISNAVKFTSRGEVRVAVERTADPRTGEPRLSISVTDTGIGVAPENLDKLFDKFTQADSTTTRRFGGTGLGLTITKQIVELMGGSIRVASTVGEGTRFHIELPLTWKGAAVTAARAVAEAEEAEVDISGLRVLAAEDNETNRLVLKTILHSLGVAPVVVENGAEAVEALETAAFDLVLMDVQMPVMDGVAATREIRRREGERGQPPSFIVALSANAMTHQVQEYLAAGLDAHLAKPIEIERLYAVLAQAALRADAAPRLSGAA